MQIVIACSRPGMLRAGVRHPARETYLAASFTPDQLREMLADPALTVSLGRLMTAEDIAQFEASGRMAPASTPHEPAHDLTGALADQAMRHDRPVSGNPAARRARRVNGDA